MCIYFQFVSPKPLHNFHIAPIGGIYHLHNILTFWKKNIYWMVNHLCTYLLIYDEQNQLSHGEYLRYPSINDLPLDIFPLQHIRCSPDLQIALYQFKWSLPLAP